MIQKTSIRPALLMSAVLHAVSAVAWWIVAPAAVRGGELIDIEVAPPPPPVEALPPEVARPPAQELADRTREAAEEPGSTAPSEPAQHPGEGVADAGVDAAPDAPPDAPPDARPDARPDAAPDAEIDAGPEIVAERDGGEPDALEPEVASADDAGGDASQVISNAGDAGADDDAGDAAQVASAERGDAGVDASQVAATSPRDGGDVARGEHAADAGTDAPAIAIAEVRDGGETASSKAAAPADRSGSGAAGSGAGSDLPAGTFDPAILAAELASSSGVPGASDQPAVDGAPTTAGTAANLLAYFPDGHVVTALIRFDRLRGTEWAAQTERLLRPLPDYRVLFGAREANLVDRLETLVISSPRPRDATATTLVGRTALPRAALRDFLASNGPVAWSVARGGLLGRPTGKRFPGDVRVFLSPFQGWFLLAQPADLGALTAAARGNADTVEATGALPAWLAGIRKIESETGDPRGPAVVVTLGLPGKRVALAGNDFGLGIPSVPAPERVSIAMELVPRGWLVRGNLRFASEADAAELVASVQRVQQRITGSRVLQLVIGKPIAHVIASLAFARNGLRVSYATSISIADARAILAAVAQQLDQFFRRAP